MLFYRIFLSVWLRGSQSSEQLFLLFHNYLIDNIFLINYLLSSHVHCTWIVYEYLPGTGNAETSINTLPTCWSAWWLLFHHDITAANEDDDNDVSSTHTCFYLLFKGIKQSYYFAFLIIFPALSPQFPIKWK